MHRSGPPNNTAVTLTTKDAGSSVKEIFYSLDGQTFDHYSQAIHVNVSQARAIFAFADDNVANRSVSFLSRSCNKDNQHHVHTSL